MVEGAVLEREQDDVGDASGRLQGATCAVPVERKDCEDEAMGSEDGVEVRPQHTATRSCYHHDCYGAAASTVLLVGVLRLEYAA